MRRIAAFVIALLLLSPAAQAKSLQFPPLTGRVVDDAHIINEADARALDKLLAQHEAATTDQIVVVTLPSLQGDEIEDFGYRLGRAWGIGQKGKDNGALLIVAPAERKVRIEVGYGLEGKLTDAASSLIIGSVITPRFRRGDLSGGVVAGTEAILSVLGDNNVPQAANAPAPYANDDGGGLPWWVWLVIIVAFILLRSRVFPFLPFGGFGGGWRGGRGGNDDEGGGFSGGGGSFGGGGSSGSW